MNHDRKSERHLYILMNAFQANVNLSALTDVILGQNHVGSVIKQAPLDEDEEDQDEMESDAVDEVRSRSFLWSLVS